MRSLSALYEVKATQPPNGCSIECDWVIGVPYNLASVYINAILLNYFFLIKMAQI